MEGITSSIALIGLSGTGKSTVGRALAAQLGWPLHDTDALLVVAAGRSIPQIFAEEGEAGFRDYEAAALRAAVGAGPSIVATGAGIVLRAENRALLREHGIVVWLDAPTDVIIARLSAHDEARPLLAGAARAKLEALRAARAALYAEVADVRVATEQLSAEAVSHRLWHQLRQRIPMSAPIHSRNNDL